MDMSLFIPTDPAVRRDGWSPGRKLRFLDHLAAGGNVRAACKAVGMTRESAYALRRRGALFARGWAAALLLAREAGLETLADKALEGIEEQVWYRGERVGTRRRFDSRLLLAHLARLDRQVEAAAGRAAEDAERFDEILGCIAGAEVPDELKVAGEPLPLDRDSALLMAADEARETMNEKWAAQRRRPAEGGDAGEDEAEPAGLSDEALAEYRVELEAGIAEACNGARARWDGWFESACRAADALRGRAEPAAEIGPASARTVSEVSGSASAATFEGPDGRHYARA